jgi:ribose 5-phosphate isomerase B
VHDAPTADGARRWNDANVLALSLRSTSVASSARSSTRGSRPAPSEDPADAANVAHVDAIGA